MYCRFSNRNTITCSRDVHQPVAPEVPHPIPQIVVDQILFIAEEGTCNVTRPCVILAALVAVAAADTQGYGAPPPRYASSEEIAILRDDRVIEDDGRYNFDMETANGIVVSESGSPDGPEGAITSAGSFSYTAPDGSDIHLQFVADENGFQPQGAHLPVAPEFPHPIPQFVLDQIAFAAEEDARNAKRPSVGYQ
ncbi:cuticle protein CP14.6-like [Penaeus japonicus]|uniref:cuticle protein CP14.6-like n=1 Tax=Penaeus japonicus TaxID=27405 RepID=UPI001C711EFB|nr:cuticle protein CP14.6-like [Penaeus japonicus]